VTGSGCCASTTAAATTAAAAGSCCCNSTGCSWGRAACSSGCGCTAGSPCACCASWLARSLFFFSLFSLRSLFFSFRLEILKGQFHEVVDLFFQTPVYHNSVSHTVKLLWIQSTLFCNRHICFRTEAITFLNFNISPIAVHARFPYPPASPQKNCLK
jgi:hypothetical protein